MYHSFGWVRKASYAFIFAVLMSSVWMTTIARAADNELTPQEQREGWKLLFDGRTLDGWMTSSEQPSKRPVEDGALNPHRCGGYMLVHREPRENFVLSLDFKISPKCNSGIFLRTGSLKPRPGKDVGFNGIEVAIDDTTGTGFHDTGALYDLVAPRVQAMRPAGEWNHMVITSHGNVVEVELNGQLVSRANFDAWTEPNKRPDGSAHKFDVAYSEHPQRGYIGLQDHGGDCWYKNIKLKPLAAPKPFSLSLRQQAEVKPGSGAFFTVERPDSFDPRRTAVIVCDVWDYHHCLNAVRRLDEFLPRLDALLTEARQRGCVIIHAPSDCMDAYAHHPARRRAMQSPKAAKSPPDIATWCSRIPTEEKAIYPIDQSDGGEDDDPAEHAEWAAKLKALGRNLGMPWKSQNEKITIDSELDYISDRGDEVWNILQDRQINYVVLTGVHTNMCVIGRPFGLRQMAKNGMPVVLMRDLTDTMYNPKRWPYIDHYTGTDLIIDHIERYVCPTTTSNQLLGGEPFHFKNDKRSDAERKGRLVSRPLTREALSQQWTICQLPSTWDAATVGLLKTYDGTAWYRCAVHVPDAWIEKHPMQLTVPTSSEQVAVWCNGKPLARVTAHKIPPGAAVFSLTKESWLTSDANLIVVRVSGSKSETNLPKAPLITSDENQLSLSGRWQFRLGDDASWSNIPLPARFGIGTDYLFQP